MAVSERVLEVKQFLQSTSIFQNIIDEQLQALANIAIPQTYKKGVTLFWEGDEGTGFFIIKSGRIKIFKVANGGKEQIFHIFGADDYFAEVPTFDGGKFPASAAALENSEVVFIPRTAFLLVLQQHPTLALAMLGTFARHLRKLTHLVDTLSFKEVPERLAHYLLNLSDRKNIGTIPETLSRTFYKFSQEGIIEMNGTTIKLCDRERLRSLNKHK